MTASTSPSVLSAGQLNAELDRLEARASRLNDRLIEEGRGHERPSETRLRTDDLSAEWRAVHDRLAELRREVEARFGPGAPSRLPAGFRGRAR